MYFQPGNSTLSRLSVMSKGTTVMASLVYPGHYLISGAVVVALSLVLFLCCHSHIEFTM